MAALVALGCMAAGSILLSDAPRVLAWPGAVVAVGWGALLARREQGRPAREVVLAPGQARNAMPLAHIDGRACPVLRLRWRGPVAFLDVDDAGQVRRLVFGPDTLGRAARRELRLIVPRTAPASARASVAP